MRNRSHRLVLIVALLVVWIAGCSDAGPGRSSGSGLKEKTAKTTQFVVWLADDDPLVTEHTQWHLGACGSSGARQCPPSGQEFLTFHRNFLHRLRAKALSLGVSADLTPWYSLPPEMKDPSNGWTSALDLRRMEHLP